MNLVKATSKIRRVTPRGKTTVYDFTVTDTHRILANGFYTSNCNHPDVETFIDIKRDKKKVTGANISVKTNDEFMRAVESDGDFELRWPVDSAEPVVRRIVKARHIWDKMMDSAWESAEPGVFFWDTVTRMTPSDLYSDLGFGSVSSNPCVTGDTIVITDQGEKTVKELADRCARFQVLSYDTENRSASYENAIAFMTKQNAETCTIQTVNGRQIRLTPDHKVYTKKSWVKAEDLSPGDSLLLSTSGHGIEDWDMIHSIVSGTSDDVYDLSVDNNHNFFANSVLVHNCGEIIMSPKSSCKLLVVNLLSFVKDPFVFPTFDFSRFAEVVVKAQRLMDDIIDLEVEKIDQILEKVENDPQPEEVKCVERDLWKEIRRVALAERRTGLGITALGDCLAALNVRYGSDESVEWTERIYRELALNAYRSTVQMAMERGAFDGCDPGREETHPFLSSIMNLDPELRDEWMVHGRRNIALTTTAPAGSVSTLTQTTSGIEPAFKLWYTRRKKITGQDVDQTPDFVDQSGDRWKEYDVFHHGFQRWMDATGLTKEDVEKSPYFKATANEIDWIQAVKIQAAAQRWICQSISKTCNIPEDIDKETVKKIYMEAWKSGCKGFTIYREGSRSGVLVEKKDKTQPTDGRVETFVTRSAPKRPEVLPCDIHHVNVKGTPWTILVGLMDGKPYEVMGGSSAEMVEIPRKCKSGFLHKRSRKTKSSIYDLVIGEGDDTLKVKNVVSVFNNPDYASFTRLLSLALRHGSSPQYVCEQLLKGEPDAGLFSFTKVVSRVLKTYIVDGAVPGGSRDCKECGAKDSLKYSEGCVSCVSCSSSKCG